MANTILATNGENHVKLKLYPTSRLASHQAIKVLHASALEVGMMEEGEKVLSLSDPTKSTIECSLMDECMQPPGF